MQPAVHPAKQRRNRKRATELITVLDGMVPAKYPYRAFSKPAVGPELSLQKRSRNMTLEDVIDLVRQALGKDASSRRRTRANEGKVSISEVMCSSHNALGSAILREDGEIIEASESLKRMFGVEQLKCQRVFIRSGEWQIDELTGVGTCQISPDDALVCQMDGSTSTIDSVRTLLVYRHAAHLQRQLHEIRASIPPMLDLPDADYPNSPCHSVFSTLANTARNTAYNTASNTACNSIQIHADDIAAVIAAREQGAGLGLGGMGGMGSMASMARGGMGGGAGGIGGSRSMPCSSMALPPRPGQHVSGMGGMGGVGGGGFGGGGSSSSSLAAAEAAFVQALKRLEYERSQEVCVCI